MIEDKETRQALITLATTIEKQHAALIALTNDVSALISSAGKETGRTALKFPRSSKISESSSGILQLRHLVARLKGY